MLQLNRPEQKKIYVSHPKDSMCKRDRDKDVCEFCLISSNYSKENGNLKVQHLSLVNSIDLCLTLRLLLQLFLQAPFLWLAQLRHVNFLLLAGVEGGLCLVGWFFLFIIFFLLCLFFIVRFFLITAILILLHSICYFSKHYVLLITYPASVSHLVLVVLGENSLDIIQSSKYN